MPTYEYECRACGHRFEHRQAMNEAPITECPKCRQTVSRTISGGSGFILKGSGWSRPVASKSSCSLEQEGKTCCGQDERCATPHCGK
ncbi:MAG: zinc ribbon domain-containing protein [bacterium]|nr:zinc ribbon domain-containing protein [bacterium]